MSPTKETPEHLKIEHEILKYDLEKAVKELLLLKYEATYSEEYLSLVSPEIAELEECIHLLYDAYKMARQQEVPDIIRYRHTYEQLPEEEALDDDDDGY